MLGHNSQMGKTLNWFSFGGGGAQGCVFEGQVHQEGFWSGQSLGNSWQGVRNRPHLVRGVLTGTFGMEPLGSRPKLGQIWDFLRNFPLPACLHFPTVKGTDVSFVTSSLL